MTHATAFAVLVIAASAAWSSEGRIPAQPSYVIPFEFDENTAWLQVKVNGHGPFTFMLDTGAGTCAIDWATAERAGLKVVETWQDGPIGSGDGTARAGAIRHATVEVGPVRLELPSIGVVSLATVRQRGNRPFYGVIGPSLFGKYVVAVDYAERELRLYDTESFEYTGNGYVWPVGMNRGLRGEFLRRFTVIFDYERSRIILEPNGALNEIAR
jgi:hypothetical protein